MRQDSMKQQVYCAAGSNTYRLEEQPNLKRVGGGMVKSVSILTFKLLIIVLES